LSSVFLSVLPIGLAVCSERRWTVADDVVVMPSRDVRSGRALTYPAVVVR